MPFEKPIRIQICSILAISNYDVQMSCHIAVFGSDIKSDCSETNLFGEMGKETHLVHVSVGMWQSVSVSGMVYTLIRSLQFWECILCSYEKS